MAVGITAALGLAASAVVAGCEANEQCQEVSQAVNAQQTGISQAQLSAQQLNLSQQLGQNVWQMGNGDRGLAIESAEGGNLPIKFPVIDRFVNGVATSIKSIDLSTTTYQNPGSLWSTVEGYVNKLYNFQGAVYSGVQVTNVTARELLLAISPNATQAQLQTLQQLQAWATSIGIQMTIDTVQ